MKAKHHALEYIQECARILGKAVLIESSDVPYLEKQLEQAWKTYEWINNNPHRIS